MWDSESAWDLISRLMVAGHRRRGRPCEVVMEHAAQHSVVCKPNIYKSLVETINRTTIHFLVLSITAMHLDDCRLIAIEIGVRAGTAKRLAPIGRKSLHMLRVEAVAE